MQLSPSQLRNREIAALYLQIQGRGQPLRNIFRYQYKKRRSLQIFGTQVIETKSLFSLMAQTIYLLFTCAIRNYSLLISKETFCYFTRSDTMQTYREYILPLHLENLQASQQNYISLNFQLIDFADTTAFVNCVIKSLQGYLFLLKKYWETNTHLRAIVFNRWAERLQFVIQNFLKPNVLKIKEPKTLILLLEQTQAFRQNSILLSVYNNSIFMPLKTSKNSQKVFESLKKIQQKMLSELKSSQNTKHITSKPIVMMIEQTLNLLMTERIVYTQKTIGQISKDCNFGQYYQNQLEGNSFKWNFYGIEKLFEEFSQQKFQSILKNKKISSKSKDFAKYQSQNRNEFQLQYSLTRQIFSIKYITQLPISVQNSDLLLYQSNLLAFNWSTISMELTQVSNISSMYEQYRERYVCFKCYVRFEQKAGILGKILLLLQAVIVCAKVVGGQLRKFYPKIQDYWKIEEYNGLIEHLRQIFLNKVEMTYALNFSSEQE